MIDLVLVGIGTGNADHLTLQAIKALNGVDLILIPRKGGKSDLAELRRAICAQVVTNKAVVLAEFDMPVRDAAVPEYLDRVNDWHDAIALRWSDAVAAHPGAGRVALMVWGDPSLYDSTLRIAERLMPVPRMSVIAGITALQALTAGHGIAINGLGAAFLVTTGRQLRDGGWPAGVETVAVMLDGECSFMRLPPEGLSIWWSAYAGMPQEIRLAGPLRETGPRIVALRADARARHGWIMDIYLIRREG